MKKVLLIILGLALLFSFAGCSKNNGRQPDEQDDLETIEISLAKSDKSRNTAPVVVVSDKTDLAAGNSKFAFDLYQTLKSEEGNLFYSPYSISLALAMTYSGARGETERQMADTLHFELSQEQLHQAFNALDLALASRGEGAQGKDDTGFRLNIVNETWGQEDYKFLAEFLDVLAENYGASMRLLDFKKNPEASRLTINDWVSDNTEGRIEDLIPQGAIDTMTRLVLTNAIYFNAAWLNPFEEEMTADGKFNLLDGSQTTVSMMKQTESLGYMKGEGYQAVELPYDGNELSMVIVLPDAGNFGAMESSLNNDFAQALFDGISNNSVTLSLPKFEFESEFQLSDVLMAMGMPVAFSDSADFSGMTTMDKLFISAIIHKSVGAFDENGTEAAAATALPAKSLTEPPLMPMV